MGLPEGRRLVTPRRQRAGALAARVGAVVGVVTSEEGLVEEFTGFLARRPDDGIRFVDRHRDPAPLRRSPRRRSNQDSTSPGWAIMTAMKFGRLMARAAEAVAGDERLDVLAGPAGDAVRQALDRQPVKDALSGTWLGHPLHPLLTDLPIGFWTSAFTLDLVGGRRSRRAATQLVGWGVLC